MAALGAGAERVDPAAFVTALAALADRLPKAQAWVRADPGRVVGLEQELERELVALILGHFGPVSVLAEEHFSTFGQYAHLAPDTRDAPDNRLWFAVDPLDGSKSYAAGRETYAVSVAGCVGDRPVFGFVYQPSSGTLYSAAEGVGGYANDLRLGGADAASRRVAVGNGVVTDPVANLVAEKLLRESYDLEHMACTSLKFCRVADGQLAGLVKQVAASAGVLRVWGMAAGQLIAAEAGIPCVGLDRRPWRWAAGTVMAGDRRFRTDIKEQR